ncbi:MATE family efflux transporter [Cupriavidus necator]|uniref:MATE family efflux transporter n=1 Tax=Cupriavidus necator TaxID=106590 RepID=UPI0039C0F795
MRALERRCRRVHLAAIGIGNAIYVALLVILTGIANGITPVAARLWGSGAMPQLRAVLSAGMALSIGFGLLSYPLLMMCLAVLVDTDPVTEKSEERRGCQRGNAANLSEHVPRRPVRRWWRRRKPSISATIGT